MLSAQLCGSSHRLCEPFSKRTASCQSHVRRCVTHCGKASGTDVRMTKQQDEHTLLPALRKSEQASASRAPGLAAAAAAVVIAFTAQPSLAAFRLPPIDRDPNRCERAYTGNTIGQANAVSDKTLDLRSCVFKGKDLSAKVLSGALVSEADFSDSILRETVLTKAYAVKANFSGADLTNAVLDRVDFTKADLTNAKFRNAVITGVVFTDADLTGAVFEDALIGREDAKRMCANATLVGESRDGVGCRSIKG